MLAVQRFSATSAVDAAFRLYREHFAPLFLLSLVVSVPNALAALALQLVGDRLDRMAELGESAVDPATGLSLLPMLGLTALTFLVTLLVAMTSGMFGMAGATRIASMAALGRRPALRDGVDAALGSFWPLLGATMLSSLAASLGLLLFIVPGLVAYVGFSFVAPVIVLERLSVTEALSRSWELTRGRRWKIFGALFLVWVMIIGVMGGLTIALVLGGVLGEGLTSALVETSLTQALYAVALPVMYAATVLLYYDARVEREAFDVELLARAAADASP